MITDPIPLRMLIATGTAYTFANPDTTGGTLMPTSGTLAMIDLSPGKTVRIGPINDGTTPGRVTLTISHSESNENKGQITDRVAFRLDVRKDISVADNVTLPTTAQATLTVSSPRSNFNGSEILGIVRTLLGTLLIDSAHKLTADTLVRALAGEP